jgi:hypothetical protein
MTENQKHWLAYLIISLTTLAVALFFGVQYPMPEPPPEPLSPLPTATLPSTPYLVELGSHFSNPVDIEGSASAAAPALTFQGDADTGLYRSAADTIKIATGGSDEVTIDSSGVTIAGTLTQGGSSGLSDTTINGNLSVTGTADLQGNVSSTTGAVTVTDNLVVTGTADIGGDVTLENDETLSNSTDGSITANVASDGSFNVTTGNLKVGDGTPAISMDGEDLYVEGWAEFPGYLFSTGYTSLDGTLVVDPAEVSVNAGGTEISSAYPFVVIDCTGAYTATIADGTAAGQLLYLINVGSGNLTLEEASYNAQTGGDVVLSGSQYDAATFLWYSDGMATSTWVRLATGDN